MQSTSYFPSPPTSPENEITLSHKRKRSLSNTGVTRPKKQVKLDVPILEKYLNLGGSPNVHDNRRGWNLLCWACQSRSEPAIRLLLQQGDLDPNASKNGMTALQTAATLGFLSGLNLILQHPHVDLDATNHLGQTAVHCAVQANQPDCLLALLDAGARLDVRDRQGRHALHLAVLHRHLHCVQTILDRRGRNNPTNLDMLPSMIEEAVTVGYAPVLDRLLRESPDTAPPPHLARLAVFWNRLECLHLLIHTGCDISSPNINDPTDTPLYCAVQQRKLDLVRTLRAAGADPCHRDSNPSLLYAANHGFLEMIPLLLTNNTSDDCIYQAALLADSVGRRRQFLTLIQAWKAKTCKSSPSPLT